MAYQFVGIGQAGCSLLDSVFKFKNIRLLGSPTAINSTAKDLANLKIVKDKANWLGISSERGVVKGDEKDVVFEEIVTGGFGKNPVRAAEVCEEHYDSLLSALEERMKSETGVEKSKKIGLKKKKSEEVETAHVPFSILFLSFGGGTGCGVAPYVAKALKELSEENTRIIVVGALPAADQMLEAWNTRYGINELKKYADSFILVDNQKIAYRADYETLYPRYNDYVAASIADLTAGLVLEKIDPSEYGEINPPVCDMSDVITATSLDSEPCFATLGRTSMMSRPLPKYFFPFGGHREIDTLTLCRLTVEKLTVADVDLTKTLKNLALLKVPVYYLQKEGRLDVKQVEDFMLERSALGECHFCISLTKRSLVSLTTLFTHKYDEINRLKQVEQLAEEYESRGGRGGEGV